MRINIFPVVDANLYITLDFFGEFLETNYQNKCMNFYYLLIIEVP